MEVNPDTPVIPDPTKAFAVETVHELTLDTALLLLAIDAFDGELRVISTRPDDPSSWRELGNLYLAGLVTDTLEDPPGRFRPTSHGRDVAHELRSLISRCCEWPYG